MPGYRVTVPWLFGTPGMRARVVRPGATERNGLGAQREVVAGPVRFLEDVTRFDRPSGYDYRIVRFQHGPIRMVDEGVSGALGRR